MLCSKKNRFKFALRFDNRFQKQGEVAQSVRAQDS